VRSDSCKVCTRAWIWYVTGSREVYVWATIAIGFFSPCFLPLIFPNPFSCTVSFIKSSHDMWSHIV